MKAFSFIELLIVIAILGILATIVVPSFTNLKKNSQTAEAKTALASLVRREQAYFFTHAEYTDDLDAIDFHFESTFYLIGFGQQTSLTPNIKIHRGSPSISVPLSKKCVLDSNRSKFVVGSSNDEDLNNFSINHRGCLQKETCDKYSYNPKSATNSCL